MSKRRLIRNSRLKDFMLTDYQMKNNSRPGKVGFSILILNRSFKQNSTDIISVSENFEIIPLGIDSNKPFREPPTAFHFHN